MLTEISIRDFVLIERLDMSLESGLTVLTGETGAGKSILLDALGAACGNRSESGLVRPGAEKAGVTASFSLPPGHPVLALLAAHDALPDGGDTTDPLLLRRVITPDGRSKAFINDQPVSVGLLRDVGSRLVEVHGQFDTHGLLDPSTHRGTLDLFAGENGQAVSKAWDSWQDALRREEDARAAFVSARAEEEALQEAVDTLTRLSPAVGEEEALLERRKLLQAREKLAGALSTALDALSGDRGAEASLATASRALARLGEAAEIERIAQALARIDSARDAVAEAGSALESVAHDSGADGASLEDVEERLYALRAAARRHSVTPDDLPDLCASLADRLSRLTAGEDGLRTLAEASLRTKATYDRAALDLSARRKSAARKLEKAVQAELIPLRMDKARFSIAISDSPPGPSGTDSVQFEAVTNPGTPPGPLNRIASGGELARFMLALKVALAGVGDAVTLVFDEVDQGVGGAVASAVGDRLAHLSRKVQVLVVTHAPQVAAKARHHWKVSKAMTGKVTRTSVEVLPPPDRREEIARMLAGDTVTEAARTAASALLEPSP